MSDRSYGTVCLVEGHFKRGKAEAELVWEVTAEPHVMIKLKRVFPQLAADFNKAVHLTASDEVSADLRWFLVRYPMEVDKPDQLESLANAYKDRMTLVNELLTRVQPPPEFDLAIPMREYQRLASGMVLKTGSLLLADEVGLGKTISAIGVLTGEGALPALVVTLAHLPTQWEREIHRFTPKLTTHVLKKGQPYDLTRPGRGEQLGWPGRFPDVVITNYHKLAGWCDTLAPIVKTLVFDECAELRRGDSGKYSAARLLSQDARYRIGLSATPFWNLGHELFHVMEIIRPGSLGTRNEFLIEWCSYDGTTIKEPKAFGTYLRESGLMLRRTRSEVGRELPPLQTIVTEIDADSKAIEKAEDAASELAKIILTQGAKGWDKIEAGREMDMRLRQATGIAKAHYVAEFVRALVENEERVLIYVWHREVYSLLMFKLKDLNPVMYSGTESPVQKEESKRKFMEGESKVMLMSLRAGQGLDGLQTVCRTVVFAELDWSPACHVQNIGRVFRDGQTDPVIAYFPLANSGSDPIIADVLQLKSQQIDGVIDPDADLIETLDTGENHMRLLAEAILKRSGIVMPVQQALNLEASS